MIELRICPSIIDTKKSIESIAHDGEKSEFVFSFFWRCLKKETCCKNKKNNNNKIKHTTLQKNKYTNFPFLKKIIFPPQIQTFQFLFCMISEFFVFDVVIQWKYCHVSVVFIFKKQNKQITTAQEKRKYLKKVALVDYKCILLLSLHHNFLMVRCEGKIKHTTDITNKQK
ncbi:hypothetical protein RFI_33165 [Reticulomyxa filosa]|uniref:Uncharacterized protein n=1 Tax=Reticulomyxa filosa TaxID=46433 RepID=X6LSZ2_RETFI|nr:hypothetical protein RFI_33165 [Reticulomyxa filosa]|eukprot:ETO04232.1 hypothetical protein RFI_33165 [Reticulomyxa filosa]